MFSFMFLMIDISLWWYEISMYFNFYFHNNKRNWKVYRLFLDLFVQFFMNLVVRYQEFHIIFWSLLWIPDTNTLSFKIDKDFLIFGACLFIVAFVFLISCHFIIHGIITWATEIFSRKVLLWPMSWNALPFFFVLEFPEIHFNRNKNGHP